MQEMSEEYSSRVAKMQSDHQHTMKEKDQKHKEDVNELGHALWVEKTRNRASEVAIEVRVVSAMCLCTLVGK
jgi:hypothetical protein